GIRTNSWCETSLPGFFAAGECACVSIHGANRLGGNSLLETIVFGRRAGIRASRYIRDSGPAECSSQSLDEQKERINGLLSRKSGVRVGELRRKLGSIMTDYLGIFRTRDKMETGLSRLREVRDQYGSIYLQDRGKIYNSELAHALELGSLLDLAETITVGAIAREESRGSHYRLDFPERNDSDWLKHSLAFRTDSGPHLEFESVTITRFPPKT
ncbi:MAG TPA: FAD-binding protein, partial [Nitrospiria bacterium]|nr:FAD-binding protein [Nitrospiria bacterium]